MGDSSEQQRKLFLGGLDYGTTEEGLQAFFGKYGELVDSVVMRFPDTKRSRGFGFITFATADQAEACFDDRPHTVDGKEVETKRATPREESVTDNDRKREEAHRKLFVGGLNYSTTDDGLRG